MGCTATSTEVRVGVLVDRLDALYPQTVSAAALPDFGGPGQPDGLVGSDVVPVSRPCASTSPNSTSRVPGDEGAFPTSPVITNGPDASTPVPPGLVMGTATTVAPMRVERPGASTDKYAGAAGSAPPPAVRSRHRGLPIGHDRATGRRLDLAPSNVAARQTRRVRRSPCPAYSGRWSASGTPYAPADRLDKSGVVGSVGFVGLLGADQMSRFGLVVFDYQRGPARLGAG